MRRIRSQAKPVVAFVWSAAPGAGLDAELDRLFGPRRRLASRRLPAAGLAGSAGGVIR